LEWAPDHPVPYLHQVQAVAAAQQQGPRPRADADYDWLPGSGKDRGVPDPGPRPLSPRAGPPGKSGVKAVLLYPMNALATDQADRINKLLTASGLSMVTAGQSTSASAPDTVYPRVETERSKMRREPPDILITNYKMLDLLLQRARRPPAMAGRRPPLRGGRRVSYLRRRRQGNRRRDGCCAGSPQRLAHAESEQAPGPDLPGRHQLPPWEETTGSTEKIREVAEEVFGTPFTDDSVIREQRLAVAGFLGQPDYAPAAARPEGTRRACPTRGWMRQR